MLGWVEPINNQQTILRCDNMLCVDVRDVCPQPGWWELRSQINMLLSTQHPQCVPSQHVLHPHINIRTRTGPGQDQDTVRQVERTTFTDDNLLNYKKDSYWMDVKCQVL